MIESGAPLPNVEVCDLRGRSGNLVDLATNGVPVVLFASAYSPLCRDLEEAFEAFARLDEGAYNVWAIVEGSPVAVARAFPNLCGRIRCFPVPKGWEGFGEFGLTAFPGLVVADRANVVVRSSEGWDRAEWQKMLQETEAMLRWRPTVLSRKLPAPAMAPVA